MLKIKNVSMRFDEFLALEDVSFSVGDGEIKAIIGPNGAGKTTLLNVVTGYLRPTRGRIILNDEDLTGQPPFRIARRGLVRSFQVPGVFPMLTVIENILAALEDRATSFILRNPMAIPSGEIRRGLEVLQAFGLEEYTSRVAGELSHGAQRLLELAMVLNQPRAMVLLDEPTAGLSLAEKQRVMELILGAARDSKVLMVEHDMSVVMDLATSVVVLHQGQVVLQGQPKEIRSSDLVRSIYLGVEG